MKNLNDILKHVNIRSISANSDILISTISFDSRKVEKDSLFVAVKGTQVDGHKYISQAVDKGAIAIICEDLPSVIEAHVCYITTNDSSVTLGITCSNYFDNPSKKLNLVGVTGTNGKTTIATLLYDLFTELGYKSGLLSTISNRIGEKNITSTHTTADALAINKLLAEMANTGCKYCFMEVSSHAIDQNRIAGLHFKGGIFTNITHDHLDYHKDFKSYINAKKKFFDELSKEAFALTNTDDKNGKVMVQNTRANVKTYSLNHLSDFKASIKSNTIEGLNLLIDKQDVWFSLSGKFNAYNLLAVYGAAVLLDQDKDEILRILSNLKGAEGRFDIIKGEGNITGIVDYAHTPDALKNILSTINQLLQPGQSLITVAGAGGDRDTSKRPVMGDIASELSHKLIITSDNPRSENPELIIADVKKGVREENLSKVLEISNRKEAIRTACMLARPGDIVLVAGKGHEKYQEINGVKHHFDDAEVLSEILKNQRS